eukprot:TRINITY_DN1296_c0_g1_i1.p1 TRINITY_DN1296_c0_g1~~TRINITY_DN1296_c0_g1_i1.p1  ORF type:complete len:322 (-),score=157.51 TRINITY_DN1296_c0_g1_i1:46-915(-)
MGTTPTPTPPIKEEGSSDSEGEVEERTEGAKSSALLVISANELLEKIEREEEEDNEQEKNTDSDSTHHNEGLRKALDQFEEAISLDSTNLDAYLGKAYVMGLLEDFDGGSSTLQRAEVLSPDDPRVSEMISALQEMRNGKDEEEDDEEDDEEEEEENESKESNAAEGNIPMLVRNGTMTKNFYRVLRVVFEHFDEDCDGCWNDKEVGKFYETVNGESIDHSTLKFLRDHFQTNKKGNLTMVGFFEFYLSQTAGSAEETWNDLQKLGFNQKLEEVDDRYRKLDLSAKKGK